jgi:hypothetical protein
MREQNPGMRQAGRNYTAGSEFYGGAYAAAIGNS